MNCNACPDRDDCIYHGDCPHGGDETTTDDSEE